jgi:TRAP-type C4-dicarboxylate transport system permease small subunit
MESLRHRTTGRPPEGGGLDIRLWLERTLGLGAALILFALVLVTCVDVVGRYFLDAPLRGAFEMTELLVAALVFAALPLTTERREHVEVDLLNAAFPLQMNRLVSAAAGLFSACLLTTFAWRLASHATRLTEDGAVTNALEIPLAPIAWLAAFSCLVSAFLAFLRGVVPPNEPGPAEKEEGAV